jgi:hypothetical protein
VGLQRRDGEPGQPRREARTMSAGPRDSSTGGYLVPTTPLPLDDEILHRRISNLIAGITGLPGNLVRPRWQPNPPQIPAPETNWVAVGVVTYPSSHGTPVRRHISDGDGYDVLDDPELIRLLASFYGPNCGAYARLCRHALWVEQNWEQLAPLGTQPFRRRRHRGGRGRLERDLVSAGRSADHLGPGPHANLHDPEYSPGRWRCSRPVCQWRRG